MKKALKFFGIVVVALFLLSLTVAYVRSRTPLPPRPPRFTVIAHHGVHQTFPPGGVDNDTCTASLIRPVTHQFIENTIPSITEAFKDGAGIVEIDIHPTRDGHLVVFHDWRVDCRTNGHGVTHDLSLAELKKLDIGYGYTADGGKTYPLRGTGVGLMPSLEEVLTALPDQQFLVNQKDNSLQTTRLLGSLLNRLSPGQRSRIYYLGSAANFAELQRTVPDAKRLFAGPAEIKRCGKALLLSLGFGTLPEACMIHGIALPARYLWLVPGWPNDFLSKTFAAGVPVYITEVDSLQDLEKLYPLPIHGIVTDRIEVLGPVLSPVDPKTESAPPGH
jgi:glycerophosphoryl diester phosphodiesterase